MPTNKSGVSFEWHPAPEQVASRIGHLPKAYIAEVMDELGEYAVDVLKAEQPKYKHITRAQAYPNAPAGPGWFSHKQRRYVMAKIRSGEISIPYRRTGRMADAWKFTATDNSFVLSNPTAAAFYTMGEQQSRHEALVGWKKALKILQGALSFKSSKFRRAVEVAYHRALRKVKLG